MKQGALQQPQAVLQAAVWQARLGADDVAAREQADFQAWLSADTDNRRAWDSIQALTDDINILSGLARESGEVLSSTMQRAVADCKAEVASVAGKVKALAWRSRRRKALQRGAGAIAASLLLAVLVHLVGWPLPWQAGGDAVPRYTTAVGEQRTVMLADGSLLTLNTDTSLSVAISDSGRRIHMVEGEAYFDVAADSQRPFVVTLKNSFVRVTGTAFNIRQRGRQAIITVMEGKVQVGSDVRVGDSSALHYLERGEQAFFDGDKFTYHKLEDNALNNVMLWREGKLSFDNQTVDKIVEEIQYYSKEKIVIGNAEIGNLTAGGIFYTDELTSFIDAMENGLPVRAVRRNGVILLVKKQDVANDAKQ